MKPELFSDLPPEFSNRENPFKVPDGYFDRLPLKISTLLEEEKQTRRFPFPFLLRPAPLLATCTAFCVLLVFGYRIFVQETTQLTDDEISNFVYQEGIIDELDEDEILFYSGIAEASDSTWAKNPDSEEQAVIQRYLIDEDIEMNEIIDEL